MEITQFSNLLPRILYLWSRIYGMALQPGQDWNILKPVYSIVIFNKKNKDLLKDYNNYISVH